MNVTPSRAAILCRISDDKQGDEKGVDRQEADGRGLATQLSWGVGEVVIENDTSAYKRKRTRLPDGSYALRTVRPGFRRLIDMLASGEADGLIAYDLDRACRDPRDLEDLIDVVEERNIPVASVSGSLRLGNDADISMARVMVAIANKASRDASRRVKRKQEELAAEGKPSGGGIRAYGYDKTQMLVVDDEAKVIREIAERLIAGDSMHAIAGDFNKRGIPAARGGTWSTRSVRSVVSKPRVAGLRSTGKGSKMEIVGPAIWPAILTEDTWEEVCAALAVRGRTAKNQLARWLSGVLHCSFCNHTLIGARGNSGTHRYWCATPRGGCGKIAIGALATEEEVERQVLDLLSKPRVLEQLRAWSNTTSTKGARSELAEDEAQLKEMAGAYARKQMTFPEYMEARRIVEARVKEARALLVSTAPRILRGLLVGDVREGWAALAPADRREVVLALVPDGYEVLPFVPTPGKRRGFDAARLRPIAAR